MFKRGVPENLPLLDLDEIHRILNSAITQCVKSTLNEAHKELEAIKANLQKGSLTQADLKSIGQKLQAIADSQTSAEEQLVKIHSPKSDSPKHRIFWQDGRLHYLGKDKDLPPSPKKSH